MKNKKTQRKRLDSLEKVTFWAYAALPIRIAENKTKEEYSEISLIRTVDSNIPQGIKLLIFSLAAKHTLYTFKCHNYLL